MPTPAIHRNPSAAGASIAGGAPSTMRATGSRASPPTTSCQETSVSRSTGAFQRLISTNPSALTSTDPKAPTSPSVSTWPGLRSTSKRHADQPDECGGDADHAGPLADHQPGDGHHGEGRAGLEGGGQAAGEVVGGQEDEREEHPDVAQPEHDRLPPPVAVGEPAAVGQQHEADRQGADRGREQRTVGRQELLGDDVRRAPGDRGHRGDEGCRPVVVFHGRHFSFQGR